MTTTPDPRIPAGADPASHRRPLAAPLATTTRLNSTALIAATAEPKLPRWVGE